MPAVPYKTSNYLKTPQAIVEYLKLPCLRTRKVTTRIC